ncbi:TolC family protein [Segetibacter sp. 3557_3]|uniref:TolC family protein n=1 Tax=Segetibacter sp. 3557_3 TaxID=2547429 RepID=UPI001058D544|nr:TolC family protein [Segetibacter sp. 3557_3]TDH26563.1 TolC family protein [Segetibacter sp. 3557_3]
MKVKIFRGLLFFSGLLFFINSAICQNVKHISLEEAIDLSIKNSKQLKINRAQVEEAAATVREAIDRRLPDATASGSYLRLAQPNIKLLTGKDSSTAGAGGPSVSQAVYGIVNLSLPIYAGHRIRYGIASARYLEQAIALDGESQREEVVLNTMDAYTNLYKARAATSLVKDNLEQSKQRVKDFSNLEKNGLLARNELLKAELQTSNIELSLLDAENNWKMAMVNMNLMLGLPETTEIAADSINLDNTISVKSIAEYEQLANQHRKDIEALDYRKKAASTAVMATKAEALPSIALTGGYVAAHVPNFLTITNAVNVGVGVQYNIASLWKSAKVQQAKAREKQVIASQEQLTDAIHLQINKAYQDYLSSRKKIEVYAKAVEQATENYKISKNKYNNALLTTTDLLDADVAQLQAKLNYQFAKADAALAYNKLLQTAGLLTSPTTTK